MHVLFTRRSHEFSWLRFSVNDPRDAHFARPLVGLCDGAGSGHPDDASDS